MPECLRYRWKDKNIVRSVKGWEIFVIAVTQRNVACRRGAFQHETVKCAAGYRNFIEIHRDRRVRGASFGAEPLQRAAKNSGILVRIIDGDINQSQRSIRGPGPLRRRRVKQGGQSPVGIDRALFGQFRPPVQQQILHGVGRHHHMIGVLRRGQHQISSKITQDRAHCALLRSNVRQVKRIEQAAFAQEQNLRNWRPQKPETGGRKRTSGAISRTTRRQANCDHATRRNGP